MANNQQIFLTHKPNGLPDQSHFQLVESPVPQPELSEILVRTIYITLDPYMRGMMGGEGFLSEVNKQVFGGDAVGQVIHSNNPAFKQGDYVLGSWRWQTYAAVKPETLRKLDPALAPISTALGVLGMPGMTAYFGMLDIGRPKEGETVVISGAAGAVGSLAGQIAINSGARVIGIASSEEKINYLTHELGFAEVINYKTSKDIHSDLNALAPNGVDVYFDNVGGDISDAVIRLIRKDARIVVCGQISQYNKEVPEKGLRVAHLLLDNSAMMKGFYAHQYIEQYAEGRKQLGQWIQEGKIKYKESIIEGFENVPTAFLGLFSGVNIGKLLVKVADE